MVAETPALDTWWRSSASPSKEERRWKEDRRRQEGRRFGYKTTATYVDYTAGRLPLPLIPRTNATRSPATAAALAWIYPARRPIHHREPSSSPPTVGPHLHRQRAPQSLQGILLASSLATARRRSSRQRHPPPSASSALLRSRRRPQDLRRRNLGPSPPPPPPSSNAGAALLQHRRGPPPPLWSTKAMVLCASY
uniref:Uncharacterized protein n=1 Tax=Oryza rufipogon TaxID=4529 RepID=A0A0E0Q6G7_ORYRU